MNGIKGFQKEIIMKGTGSPLLILVFTIGEFGVKDLDITKGNITGDEVKRT